ncbi:glutamate racemase [Pseudoalteromonas atlantica]|uniref:glutamate racemase n=1 Tax=Pseudoalteromonas atlantica TaxID=288 RepID=UPI003734DF73
MSSHILVFDSGIGGTTVLEHIQALIPNASFSYFMDNAYLPYGELSSQQIIARLTSLLHFIENEKLHVDILVIACNTASTSALAVIRSLTTIPIVGVVPAIKPAAAITKSKRIGLLATPATTRSKYTQQLIESYGQGVTVDLYSSVELVAIAEQLYLTGEFSQFRFDQEMQRLEVHKDTDVLVLGCTHFPILAKHIDSYYDGVIQLLDSGAAIAHRVRTLLNVGEEKRIDPAVLAEQKKPLHYYATASVLTTKLNIVSVKLID